MSKNDLALVKFSCKNSVIHTSLTPDVRQILENAGFTGPSYIDGLQKGFSIDPITFSKINELIAPKLG